MRQLILAGVLLLCTVVAFPQQHDVKIDTLTIEKALAIALEHHPSLSAAEANVESAEAGGAQARSSYFPTINASATAQRNDGAFVFNPSFPPRNQTYNSFTTGFQFGLN